MSRSGIDFVESGRVMVELHDVGLRAVLHLRVDHVVGEEVRDGRPYGEIASAAYAKLAAELRLRIEELQLSVEQIEQLAKDARHLTGRP